MKVATEPEKSEEALPREELVRLLKKAGKEARKKAFKAGLRVSVAIDGDIYYLYPDGSKRKAPDKPGKNVA